MVSTPVPPHRNPLRERPAKVAGTTQPSPGGALQALRLRADGTPARSPCQSDRSCSQPLAARAEDPRRPLQRRALGHLHHQRHRIPTPRDHPEPSASAPRHRTTRRDRRSRVRRVHHLQRLRIRNHAWPKKDPPWKPTSPSPPASPPDSWPPSPAGASPNSPGPDLASADTTAAPHPPPRRRNGATDWADDIRRQGPHSRPRGQSLLREGGGPPTAPAAPDGEPRTARDPGYR